MTQTQQKPNECFAMLGLSPVLPHERWVALSTKLLVCVKFSIAPTTSIVTWEVSPRESRLPFILLNNSVQPKQFTMNIGSSVFSSQLLLRIQPSYHDYCNSLYFVYSSLLKSCCNNMLSVPSPAPQHEINMHKGVSNWLN